MNDELRKYLVWRFRFNNRNAYHHYCDEWINSLLPSQTAYFYEEKKRLTERGIYKE